MTELPAERWTARNVAKKPSSIPTTSWRERDGGSGRGDLSGQRDEPIDKTAGGAWKVLRQSDGQTAKPSPRRERRDGVFLPEKRKRATHQREGISASPVDPIPSIREAYSVFIITRASAERSEVRLLGCPSLWGFADDLPAQYHGIRTSLEETWWSVTSVWGHVQSSSQNRQVRSGCARRPDPTHVETVR